MKTLTKITLALALLATAVTSRAERVNGYFCNKRDVCEQCLQ